MSKKIFKKWWFILLFLPFYFFIGVLYYIWKKTTWSRNTKVLLTGAFLVVSVALGQATDTPADLTHESSIATAETTSANPSSPTQEESSLEPENAELQSSPTPSQETAIVTRVIDGDTIELSTGEKVRYIGIDTPETVKPNTDVQCLGKEASAKNTQLVLGKEITMQKDVSETDRYGRLLRYIYVDGTFINDYLVREGYAVASSYPPDIAHQKQFAEAQQEAQANNRGLWSGVCDIQANPTTAPSQAPNQAPSQTTPQTTQPQAVPTTTSCQYSCSGPDRDCKDFATHAQAVAFFNCCGFTVTNDPMRLDGVGVDDGIPCESNP